MRAKKALLELLTSERELTADLTEVCKKANDALHQQQARCEWLVQQLAAATELSDERYRQLQELKSPKVWVPPKKTGWNRR